MAKPGRQRGIDPLAAQRTSSRRAGLFAAVAALLAVAPVAGLRADPAPPIAIAAQSEVRGHESRLTFTLQSCVPAEAYVLDSPARAIMDLPEVNFQIDPREGLAAPEIKPRRHARPKDNKRTTSLSPSRRPERAASGSAPVSGLLASYRFGKLAPGKSRIVADLTGPAAIVSVTCGPGARRLGADARAGPARPRPRSRPPPAPAPKSRPRPPRATRPPPVQPAAPQPSSAAQKPVIVIDPGHGGVDTGALGRDHAIEKFVVLEFAKVLAAKLRAGDHYRVVLTREDDSFVPLGERVHIARRLNAALFVSHPRRRPGERRRRGAGRNRLHRVGPRLRRRGRPRRGA